jgi:uncharacterized membrane protein YcjF (UPF0283 family)
MKYIYILILFACMFWGAAWLFNHVNAWLGMAATIITILIIINYVKNQIIKHLNKQ